MVGVHVHIGYNEFKQRAEADVEEADEKEVEEEGAGGDGEGGIPGRACVRREKGGEKGEKEGGNKGIDGRREGVGRRREMPLMIR